MKTFRKGYAFLAVAAVAVLVLAGCASAPKGLTESQAVGFGFSPAALYKVSVNGNAKDYTTSKAFEYVQNALQVAGGFSFVDHDRVSSIYSEEKAKAEKKAKRKDVLSVLSGDMNVLDAITDDDSSDELYLDKIYKAISKETKSKYFVRVSVTAGVVNRGLGENRSIKPSAKTSVYIYNKKASLEKEIHGISSVPAILFSSIQDKDEITKLFPELIEKSIQLAAENLHKKDKLFEIHALKDETLEIVTNNPWDVSISLWK